MIKEAIILTGLSCSGKTTYAKHLEKTQGYKYISFEGFFSYKDTTLASIMKYFDIIKKLAGSSEKIVLDGYFSNIDRYLKVFKKEVCSNVQSIVTLVSMPIDVKRVIKKFRNKKCEQLVYCVRPYLDMFPNNVNYAESKFIDSSENSFKTVEVSTIGEVEQYLREINKPAFKGYLDTLTYDKYYGDIEVINFKGYSESEKSWEHIKNLVNWKDKLVIELGCFHGFFGFKIEKHGAKVLGLDSNKDILNTTKFINWLEECSVEFKQWVGGNDIPECDVILCMNVLHHFKEKQELVLNKMNCKQAIFEINKNQLHLVKKYFKILKEVKSHRPNRIILLGGRL